MAFIVFARPVEGDVALALLAGVCVAQRPTTTRVSVDSNGAQANGASYVWNASSISADGRCVAFYSTADNLVPNDTNGTGDVFVQDRSTGSTERVSVDSSGIEGNAASFPAGISADGRYVVFYGTATNLVPNDTNGVSDVFVRDRVAGTTERVSVSSSGIQGVDRSVEGSISDDGPYVAFISRATNLAAGAYPGAFEAYVRDRFAGVTSRISYGGSDNPHLSGDGRWAFFEDTGQQVWAYELSSGTRELVSVGTLFQGCYCADFPCTLGGSSRDGRFVVFFTQADNIVAGDVNGHVDVFLRDRQQAITYLVSVSSSAQQGNGDSNGGCAISADGRYVAFASFASNLVPNDTNGNPSAQTGDDVFIRDRQSGQTERVSVTAVGGQANDSSYSPSISADGRYIAFASAATNLVPGDTNDVSDIFVRDRGAQPPEDYCTAKTNSLGCNPAIWYSGAPSINGPDSFYVNASGVLNNKTGMMLWSGTAASTPFHGGTLCIASPIVRTPLQNSGGSLPPVNDCSGLYSFHFSQAYMASHFLSPGSEVFAQFWSRDPGFSPPNNVGLTNGLHFVIGP